MNAMNLISIIASIAIIIAVFFVANENIVNFENTKTQIEIQSKENFEQGENAEFIINIESGKEITKIIYISPTKREEKNCGKKTCVLTFKEIFTEKGVFFIEIKVEIGKETFSEKKKVYVNAAGKKCSDGTAFGLCSLNKPQYCNNGKLEYNCEKCGCEQGECINNKCSYSGTTEITGISLERTFFEPNQEVKINLNSKENSLVNVVIEWKKDNKTEKTETKNTSLNYVLSVSPPKEGVYELNLVFEEKVFSVENITIRNDSTPPKTPEGIIASKRNGKILIAWNPNTEADLMEYRIYRSKEDNQAFTTYTMAETASKNETGKELEIWSTNYFYITSVDYYGNTSKPSAIIEAT